MGYSHCIREAASFPNGNYDKRVGVHFLLLGSDVKRGGLLGLSVDGHILHLRISSKHVAVYLFEAGALI